MCPAPTRPNGRSPSSQLCLLPIRGDPGLWLAAPLAVGGDERGGVAPGGQTERLVLGPRPQLLWVLAERSWIPAQEWVCKPRWESGEGWSGGRAVWVPGAKQKSSFLHGTLRFGVT